MVREPIDAETVRRCLPNITGLAGALGMAASPDAVLFFSKTKSKEEKVVFNFPLKCRLL